MFKARQKIGLTFSNLHKVQVIPSLENGIRFSSSAKKPPKGKGKGLAGKIPAVNFKPQKASKLKPDHIERNIIDDELFAKYFAKSKNPRIEEVLKSIVANNFSEFPAFKLYMQSLYEFTKGFGARALKDQETYAFSLNITDKLIKLSDSNYELVDISSLVSIYIDFADETVRMFAAANQSIDDDVQDSRVCFIDVLYRFLYRLEYLADTSIDSSPNLSALTGIEATYIQSCLDENLRFFTKRLASGSPNSILYSVKMIVDFAEHVSNIIEPLESTVHALNVYIEKQTLKNTGVEDNFCLALARIILKSKNAALDDYLALSDKIDQGFANDLLAKLVKAYKAEVGGGNPCPSSPKPR